VVLECSLCFGCRSILAWPRVWPRKRLAAWTGCTKNGPWLRRGCCRLSEMDGSVTPDQVRDALWEKRIVGRKYTLKRICTS
jgi:hypothetical protein